MGCEPPSLTLGNSRPKTCRRGFAFFRLLQSKEFIIQPSCSFFLPVSSRFFSIWPPLAPVSLTSTRLRHISGSYCGRFIYALPTLFAFPDCLTDVCSSGERASGVGPSRCSVSRKTIRSNFLWIWVQSTEANWRNKSSGRAVAKKKKKVCLLCPRHSVNSAVQNAFMPSFVYFYKGIFYAGCARLSYM